MGKKRIDWVSIQHVSLIVILVCNSYDSFGNTCGVQSNERFRDTGLPASVSGISTIDRPNVFFFDFKEFKQSLKICVKECPKKDINNPNEIYKVYKEEGSQYCRYDFDMNKLNEGLSPADDMIFDFSGPCPKLPIVESTPVLHRCIPSGKNAPHKEVQDVYKLISSWGFVDQTARDLYKSWHIILLVCFISLVLSVILIGLLHYLTQIISWLICIFVAVASIGLTALLWYTYYDIRHRKENAEISKLSQYVQNETAIYIFAIIATV